MREKQEARRVILVCHTAGQLAFGCLSEEANGEWRDDACEWSFLSTGDIVRERGNIGYDGDWQHVGVLSGGVFL